MFVFHAYSFSIALSFANPGALLSSALIEVDEGYLDIIKQKKFTFSAGCTAITALFLDHHLVIANVGGIVLCCFLCAFVYPFISFVFSDSRAVLSRSGVAIALSSDHRPSRPDERKRIEAAGGIIARTIEEYNSIRQKRIQQRIESETLMHSMLSCCCPTSSSRANVTVAEPAEEFEDEQPVCLTQRPLPLRIFPGSVVFVSIGIFPR